MSSSTTISSVCWLPRGAAQAVPHRYEISAAELAQLRGNGSKASGSAAAAAAGDASAKGNAGFSGDLDRHGLPVELRMDDYGEDGDAELWDAELDGANEEGNMMAAAARAQRILGADDGKGDSDDGVEGDGQDEDEGDADMEDEDADADADVDADAEAAEVAEANVQEEAEERMDEVEEEHMDDDLGSDEEDYIVRHTDKMVVVANTDEEYCNLEVYVFDEENGSLFVHHDIALPSFPLCTTWVGSGKSVFGDRATTDSRNYVAVGTFKPEIEIWNLDVLDALEPTVVLGAAPSEAAFAKAAKKPSTDGPDGTAPHQSSVMGLDWNSQHHHLLASASADCTVKLWDLTEAKCVHTFTHHGDKVQSVSWNPVEASVLLTGSFDQTVCVVDARSRSAGGTGAKGVQRMTLASDVECCIWNVHRPEQVLVSTEDGRVSCFDVRATAEPLYEFQAHPSKPCSAISVSCGAKGLLASCSPDKTVKLWDLDAEGAVRCVGSKTMAVGALFDVAFDVNDPFLLAAGGDGGTLALWDTSDERDVARTFSSRVAGATAGAAATSAAAATRTSGSGSAAEPEPEKKQQGDAAAAEATPAVSAAAETATSTTTTSTTSTKKKKKKKTKKKQ